MNANKPLNPIPVASNSSNLANALQSCMLADRFALRRKLRDVADLQKLKDEKSALKAQRLLGEVAQKVRASQQKFAARLASLPKPEYPLELPVSGKKDEIAEAIAKNQVVIICGETGSGKTTQIPKICLELGRGVAGLIGHTQPRRIAARSVASRIAQELNSPLGEVVGYKVRFNDKITDSSYVKLMTDGILLAETQGDKFLNAYDTIIIDEAHERSLNIDFLLGYLKQLLPKRPDLKIIVTSATIDADRFSNHFNGAPVIEVSGRTYPVEIRYRPLGKAGFRAKESSEAENAQFDLDDETIFGITRKAKTEARWLEEDDEEEAIEEAILDAADDLLRQGDGDILVFLPGEREIRDTAEHLRNHQIGNQQGRSTKLKHIEVLPLFARLSIEDQQKIFKPHSIRRIVLATNVAETSLTVPGIKYVIDAGLARMNRYSTRAKVEQLQIEKISQAAAKQRAGRCGRVSNGICVRLYSEEDFNGRPEFTEPEILRSSLASVILRMAALRLGDIADFPFIEAPSSRLISDGYLLLQELGAVDSRRQITEIGLQLAKLPLDPRVGRMILAAKREGCLNEILIIASVLSIQDPRERPMDKREAADNAHARLLVGGQAGEGSDFMSYLKLWDFFDNALKNKKSNKDLLNQCHSNFLSFLRLKEWRELHGQIVSIVEELGFHIPSPFKGEGQGGGKNAHKSREVTQFGNILPSPQPFTPALGALAPTLVGKPNTGSPLKGEGAKEATYEQIHRALLAGLLGNIGFKDGDNDAYSGARGIRFYVAPGSCLKKTRPKWVIAAELVDTSKLYARCVAKIEPDWIEPLARGLTDSQYTDPRWDRKMGMVNAWERVSLYGLTIIPKRRVHYGPINPQESREIFIREALASGEFDTKAEFFKANERLIAEVEELEHKARRQDVLIDEHQLFAFYDNKIPADIVQAATFEKWREGAEKLNPKLLYLTRDDLMRHGADAITAVQFPEKMTLFPSTYKGEGEGGGKILPSPLKGEGVSVSLSPSPSPAGGRGVRDSAGEGGGVEIPLKYRFEPNHILDGVTATIPLVLLNQLDPTQTEWLVPGMLREKLTYLIKALPKTFRRVCVPVPEFVTGFLEYMEQNPSPSFPRRRESSQADYVGSSLDSHLRGNDERERLSLIESLAKYIHQKTTLKISKDDWTEPTPAHLLMNFSVVDDAGRELAMGRDWLLLKKQLGSAAQLTFRNTSPDIEKTGLKQWDFGDLPQTLSFERDGLKVTGYPALEDDEDSISVKLFDTEREAAISHRKGVCRLMRFELKEQMKQLEKSLPNFNQYALILRNVMSSEDLREDMILAIADRAFIGEDDLPRNNADFMKLKARARTRLPAVSQALARQAQLIATEYQLLTAQQSKMPATVNRLKRDCEQQVGLLVHKHCFSQTPWEQLQHIPRYLKALRLRIEKQPANPDRDGKNAASVGALWQKWQDKINSLNQAHLDIPQALQDYRWLIEELRVSLFAQELKTPFPVSIKRLEKAWADIAR